MDPAQEMDPTTLEKACEVLAAKEAIWIVVSGKMYSGKDTVAPLTLPRLGYQDQVRVGYSDPMRQELQTAITTLTARTEENDVLAKDIVKALGLKPEHALELVEKVRPIVKEKDHGLTGSSRTEEFRLILQEIGSTWRTGEDEAYWSKKVSISCLEKLSRGKSVYLTGGRFEPDVAIPQALGAKIIRLDVTFETQAKRAWERDKLELDPKALAHAGETALDNWEHFDVREDNNGTLEECLEKVVEGLR